MRILGLGSGCEFRLWAWALAVGSGCCGLWLWELAVGGGLSLWRLAIGSGYQFLLRVRGRAVGSRCGLWLWAFAVASVYGFWFRFGFSTFPLNPSLSGHLPGFPPWPYRAARPEGAPVS